MTCDSCPSIVSQIWDTAARSPSSAFCTNSASIMEMPAIHASNFSNFSSSVDTSSTYMNR